MFSGRSARTVVTSVTKRGDASVAAESPPVHAQFVYNRNPRNLEKLRIAYKPAGYHLEKPGREFWHK